MVVRFAGEARNGSWPVESVRFRRGAGVRRGDDVSLSGGGERRDDFLGCNAGCGGVVERPDAPTAASRGEVWRRVLGAGVDTAVSTGRREPLLGLSGVECVEVVTSSKYRLGGARIRRGRSSSGVLSTWACPLSWLGWTFGGPLSSFGCT